MNPLQVLSLFFLLQEPSPITDVEKILQRVSEETRKVHTLSYHSSYKNINPGTSDSVYQLEAKIWLEILPADTIFGCRFHVQGEDRGDKYDYYYDGQMSYEIRHNSRLITIFDPYAFPNNPSNPAKAQTALSPFLFNSLLVDTRLSLTLMKNNPKVTLKESDVGFCNIEFAEPENEYGQILTRILIVDTINFVIKKIKTYVRWRGIEQTISTNISKYERNNSQEVFNISLDNQYEGYKKEFVTAPDTTPALPSKLIGTKAMNFSAPLFSGGTFTLSKLKGKIVVLDFWETWCGYCLIAFPELNELYAKYKDRGVEVIGITSENRSLTDKVISESKLQYHNVFASTKVLTKYKIDARPTYILIDREGRIVEVTYGDLGKIEASLKNIIH